MRAWLAIAVLISGVAGCWSSDVRESPGADRRRAIWRLRQQLPEEAAHEDLLNLQHALEQFWLAFAGANLGRRDKADMLAAKPPKWACDNCGAVRLGAFDQPNGAPRGACHRCGQTAAGRIFRPAHRGLFGRYPTRDEGLYAIVPFLQDDPPAPDLVDPWGMPYIYVPYDDGGFGMAAVPKGKYLLYSSGPNRIDEGGGGDDISNLPEIYQPNLIPAEALRAPTAGPMPAAPEPAGN